MNQKEISEIKRQFSPNKSAITRICGCYVNEEKLKVSEFKQPFLSLSDEEVEKYFSIFKKALSGSMGKNLVNMEFSLDAELEENGGHEFIMKLRQNELNDDRLLSEFYDRIIENYDTLEHYVILVVHQVYDVPGKTSDGIEMDDASTDVYAHILCCICPVSLTKPGLSYDEDAMTFKDRIRDWVIDKPEAGFLFPAFNDRMADIHSVLYYTSKPNDIKLDFIQPLLGCDVPLSAGDQKTVFNSLVEETLGDACEFDVIKTMHELINDKLEDAKMAEVPDPLSFEKEEVKQILFDSGASNDTLEKFDDCYADVAGNKTILQANNIVETKKFEIKSPDVVVKVKADKTNLVETRIIDGIPYILVQITDNVEVNGISVRIPGFEPKHNDDFLEDEDELAEMKASDEALAEKESAASKNE